MLITTSPTPQTSPLLTLPGELRNQIIDYAFHRPAGSAPPPTRTSALALASTCRQLYIEYHALAWSIIIFLLPWKTADDLLQKSTRNLTPDSARSIKKLQILFPPHIPDLYTTNTNPAARHRVRHFHFGVAGLKNVQELYFRYRPEHCEKEGSGGPGRELIVLLLWRLLWEHDLVGLKKICFVHDGAQPYISLTLLHGMLENFKPLGVSNRWRLKSDLEHGRLLFFETAGERVGRRVEVRVGYSFWEAERYVNVCEEIIEDKHAEVIIARRRDCAYVDPVQDMSDDALRREVGNLNTLFPVSASEDMRLQPYVQAIRDRCGQGR